MVQTISINELYNIKNKKELSCIKTFNIILEKCYKKIKSITEVGGSNMIYDIPYFLLGFPLYDIDKCIAYISKSLKKNGFMVLTSSWNKNIIYISWGINDIDVKYKKQLLLL